MTVGGINKFKFLNEVKPLRIEDLFEFALKQYGFDEATVRSVMKSNGLTSFMAESWWTYVGVLRGEYNRIVAEREYPLQCPICGAEIERAVHMDRVWRRKGEIVYRGWACKRGVGHFV